MLRIWAGFLGLLLIGAGLFVAPLWSQSLEVPNQRPAGNHPPGGGPPGEGSPPGDFGGFPGFPPGGFQPPLDPISAALDLDGNREISQEELAKASKSLRALDQNKDGKLTANEVIPPFLLGEGGGGRGMFGPPGGGQARKLLKEHDLDGDGILNKEERASARKAPAPGGGRGFGGPRGPGGPGGPPGFGGGRNSDPPKPGPTMSPTDVESFPDKGLYDTTVLRTIFIEFENADWEQELSDLHNTDVEVPATLTVDGQKYPNVGVHFRGMSSYMMVGKGYKRSLNLAMDLVDTDQKLYGYKTLNLLNANGDPSMMSSVLYSQIAKQFIPAPQANFVRVVINGESWGVYVNVQQFNKDFLKEHFDTTQGARWKVSGSPGADGGLRYLGENIEEYRRRFEIKSKDDDAAWMALIQLCKTMEETPADQLEAALSPLLDIDGALKFLALDCALVNSDGYWTRASDYSLYLDPAGQFHVIPHDMNEAFHGGGPPGGGFGPPGGGGFGGRGGGSSRERPTTGRPPGEGPPTGSLPPNEAGGPPTGGPTDDAPPGGGFGPPGRGGGGPRGGRGGFGPPGGMMHGGVDLDPLIGLDDTRKPLRSKLLAVPSLKARYLTYVRAIAEKSLDWNTVGPVVAQYRQLLEKDVEAETRKLGTFEAFLNATNPEPDKEHAEASLRHFFEARRTYLLENKAIAAMESAMAVATPAADRPAEPAQRLVTELGKKKIKLSAQPGPDSPRVLLNEVMAANTKTIRDPQDEFDDWIELYNPTDAAIHLSGMYLTDSDQAPRKWRFPEGVQIPAQGYLLLWADEQGRTDDGLHLNFKLSSKGEELFIVDTDDRGNAVIDQLKFGKQTDDVAYGRDPEHPDSWVPVSATPGKKNRVGESGNP